jgi:hypothetical protein
MKVEILIKSLSSSLSKKRCVMFLVPGSSSFVIHTFKFEPDQARPVCFVAGRGTSTSGAAGTEDAPACQSSLSSDAHARVAAHPVPVSVRTSTVHAQL